MSARSVRPPSLLCCWSFVFKHRTLLCCSLILVTISVGKKYKDHSFWWRSLHEVNTPGRCVLDDQSRRYSNYSCTRIPVDGPPTRVRISGSLLVLLTYEYPGGYGLRANPSMLRRNHSSWQLCIWFNNWPSPTHPPPLPHTPQPATQQKTLVTAAVLRKIHSHRWFWVKDFLFPFCRCVFEPILWFSLLLHVSFLFSAILKFRNQVWAI